MCEEYAMSLISVLLTLCLLAAPSMVCADETQSAKEGVKEVHEAMKKVAKAVGRKAKKDFKAADKQAKEDLKTIDKIARKAWEKAVEDLKKAVKD
jgi:hypothetical protein